MRRRRVLAVLTGTALLGSAAVAAAEKEIAAAPPNQFQPSEVTIDQGETVVFRNGDVVAHDVTAKQRGPDGEPLFASDLLEGGQRGPVRRTEHLTTGSYGFLCSVHSGMEGTLRVTSAGTPVPRPQPQPQPQPEPEPQVTAKLLSSAKTIRRNRRLRLRITSNTAGDLTITVRIGGRRAFRGTLAVPAATRTFSVSVSAKAAKRARAGRSVRIAFTGVASGKQSARLR